MPFKVKDLMIDLTAQCSVQSSLRVCQPTFCNPTFLCQFGCTHITEFCRFRCTFLPTITACGFYPSHDTCAFAGTCDFGTPITFTPTTFTPTGTTTPQFLGGQQQFGSLKEQLKAALEAAEAQEKAVEESLKPQTLADVEMLEKKLAEASDELRARKAELQKKAK